MDLADRAIVLFLVVDLAILALCFAYLAMVYGWKGVVFGLQCLALGIAMGFAVSWITDRVFGEKT